EIRLLCSWHWEAILIEIILVVLVAPHFGYWAAFHPAPALRCRPWRGESPRIIHRQGDLHGVAVFDDFQAFDNMKPAGMWCPVVVDKSFFGDPDRIDHQRVAAFIVPHRFAVP